jgi:hypothetical protein
MAPESLEIVLNCEKWSHDSVFEKGYDANVALDWPAIMIA